MFSNYGCDMPTWIKTMCTYSSSLNINDVQLANKKIFFTKIENQFQCHQLNFGVFFKTRL